LLAALLAGNEIRDESVIIRPAVGRDVAAVRMGDSVLVAKTDPITFATSRIGWYVVHINANDIATVGARPRWFLATALLPEHGTDEALVRGIWDDMRAALQKIDSELIGGHTEITVGLDRPILVGQMLGEVAPDRLIDKASVRPGDRILLTKGVPVEGTALIALEMRTALEGAFSADALNEGAGFLDDPGITVLPQAMAACEAGGVHAMHDPTEGGVATGLWELAEATGCGIVVDADRIPLLEPGASFCGHFGLDPLGTISSGSLLICAAPEAASDVAAAVRDTGVSCTDIGEALPPSEGRHMLRDGVPAPLPTFPQDEITRLFGESADSAGGTI
jgi:hydrogenase maturation factor